MTYLTARATPTCLAEYPFNMSPRQPVILPPVWLDKFAAKSPITYPARSTPQH